MLTFGAAVIQFTHKRVVTFPSLQAFSVFTVTIGHERMNILLVSAFSTGHSDIGPGRYLQKTGDGLSAALENLGHHVDTFD